MNGSQEVKQMVPSMLNQMMGKAIRNLITCPLTKQIYHTPVMAHDQKIYEEMALSQWLNQRGDKSPSTMKRMKWGWSKVTFLEPVIQGYLELFPQARRYDPKNPHAGQKEVTPQTLKKWVQERKTDELTQYLETGDPNRELIDEQKKKISLFNLVLRFGYVKIAQLLLDHPRLKMLQNPDSEGNIWYPWLSWKYQGTLEERYQLLKIFKKKKMFPSLRLDRIFKFLAPEIAPEFIKQMKPSLKKLEKKWDSVYAHDILQPEYEGQYPHWKIIVQNLIQQKVWSYETFLHYLVGNLEMLQYLLLQPLMAHDLAFACREAMKHLPSLELLLNSGADLNFMVEDDSTPFQEACMCSLEAVEMMLRYGANVNSVNSDGRNSLHLVCLYYGKNDNLTLIQLLLDHGADPLALDACNNTPRHLLHSGTGINLAQMNNLLKKAETEAKKGLKKGQKEPDQHL